MAKKKEGSRSGSSAKPKQHLKEIFKKRSGRAPSTGSREDSAAKAVQKTAEQKKEAAQKQKDTPEQKLDSDYTTVIDELVLFVNQQESVSLTELSKKYNISYARLEEWGRILFKNNLLELDYPVVGDVMLRAKGYSEKHNKKAQGKKKAGKDKGDGAVDASGAVGAVGAAGTTGTAVAAGSTQEQPVEPGAGDEGLDKKEGKNAELGSSASKEDPASPKSLEDHIGAGEKKAETAGQPAKAVEPDEKAKKKLSKKKFRLIMIGMVIFILALIAVLIYSLQKAGYIQIG